MWPPSSAWAMRSDSIFRMRALVWAVSVKMPTWAPVKERAGWPRLWIAMARRAIDTCSPVARSMSISRGSGLGAICAARATSESVVFPMADTTTTTRCPWRAVSTTRRATAFILSGAATDEPPYFCTMRLIGGILHDGGQPRKAISPHSNAPHLFSSPQWGEVGGGGEDEGEGIMSGVGGGGVQVRGRGGE